MSRERRLGRGLEALLGKVAGSGNTSGTVENQENFNTDSSKNSEFGESAVEYSLLDNNTIEDSERALHETLKSQTPSKVDIFLIDRNPYQPRLDFDTDELDSLAASISTHGLLQPIVVRKVESRYQIIAGERRFRAVTRAGWSEVPVHILSVDDRQMAELALTENIQRKDLNAIEKATAFSKYISIYGGTHEELAKRLELDRSTVTNLLRLLDLPAEIQAMVRKEELTQGHARTLIPLSEVEQIEIANRIITETWSVRQTERFVKELLESTNSGESAEKAGSWGVVDEDGNRRVPEMNVHLNKLEQEFRHHLGSKVKLSHSEKGKGKLVISFDSHEEFDRIYKWICRNKHRESA
ncbi:MAG: ParB/RepB/Spo0J family partition protein [Thermoguttaceae bacterium]